MNSIALILCGQTLEVRRRLDRPYYVTLRLVSCLTVPNANITKTRKNERDG